MINNLINFLIKLLHFVWYGTYRIIENNCKKIENNNINMWISDKVY